MKITFNTVCSILCTLVLGVTAASLAQAEPLSVQVKATKLRGEPKAWGRTVAGLKYGDQVEPLGNEQGWTKVKTRAGVTGFVHASALSAKKIVLKGKGAIDPAIDSADVVLAGKGFSLAVENEYRANNGALAFNKVDAVERSRLGEVELFEFIRAGGLSTTYAAGSSDKSTGSSTNKKRSATLE